MSEPAKVFEDSAFPGRWHVDWYDEDSHCDLEVFVGPTRPAASVAVRHAAVWPLQRGSAGTRSVKNCRLLAHLRSA